MDYTIEYRLRQEGQDGPAQRIVVDITPPIDPLVQDPKVELDRTFTIMKAALDQAGLTVCRFGIRHSDWDQLVERLRVRR